MSTTQDMIDRRLQKIEKQNLKKQQQIALDNATFQECLNIVASTKEGQYVLNRLMDRCGQNRSSFEQLNDGTFDKIITEYNEGRRSVWLFMHKYLSIKNLKIILFLDRSKLCQQKKTIKVVKKK